MDHCSTAHCKIITKPVIAQKFPSNQHNPLKCNRQSSLSYILYMWSMYTLALQSYSANSASRCIVGPNRPSSLWHHDLGAIWGAIGPPDLKFDREMVTVHVITNCSYWASHYNQPLEKMPKGDCTCTERTETVLAVQLSLVVSTLFSVKGLANQCRGVGRCFKMGVL